MKEKVIAFLSKFLLSDRVTFNIKKQKYQRFTGVFAKNCPLTEKGNSRYVTENISIEMSVNLL